MKSKENILSDKYEMKNDLKDQKNKIKWKVSGKVKAIKKTVNEKSKRSTRNFHDVADISIFQSKGNIAEINSFPPDHFFFAFPNLGEMSRKKVFFFDSFMRDPLWQSS